MTQQLVLRKQTRGQVSPTFPRLRLPGVERSLRFVVWVLLTSHRPRRQPGDSGFPGKFQTSLTCFLPKTEGEKTASQERQVLG